MSSSKSSGSKIEKGIKKGGNRVSGSSPSTRKAMEVSPTSVQQKGKPGFASARKRLDFSKVDIRAVAASAGKEVKNLGALVKSISEMQASGTSVGKVLVSLNALKVRINTTQSGSKFVLLIDETGHTSINATGKKAAAFNLYGDVESAETAQKNAVVVSVNGKISFRPSTTDSERCFVSLDWDTKFVLKALNFNALPQVHIPISFYAILNAVTEPLNASLRVPVVLGEIMTSTYDKVERTIVMMDCTGYAFITITNATDNLFAGSEEAFGPALIAGDICFSGSKHEAADAVCATIDMNKIHVQSVKRELLGT